MSNTTEATTPEQEKQPIEGVTPIDDNKIFLRSLIKNQEILLGRLHPIVKADLSGMDLSLLNLKGIQFEDCNLTGINFEASNMENCRIVRCDVSRSNFHDVYIANSYLRDLKAHYTNFSYARAYNSKISDCDLLAANLKSLNLGGCSLSFINNKDITLFKFKNGSTAHFADGYVSIGCISKTPQEWLDQADEEAKKNNYCEETKKGYIKFVKMCMEA